MVYLENSGIEYKGIKIYGTPVLPSRFERFNEIYYSRAFERTEKVRKEIYNKIPENLDILMTHSPPN